MKKLIIILMVFTAVLCYSQAESGNTQKIASEGAEKQAKRVIEKPTIEELIKTVDKLEAKQKVSENNLYSQINRLQDEKNALGKEFNKLDTGEILERSHNFYSDSFAILGVTMAIFMAIGVGLIPLLQMLKVRMDSKKVEELEKRTNDLDEKLSKLEELEKKIDTALSNNIELEKKVDEAVKTLYEKIAEVDAGIASKIFTLGR